MPLNRLSSYHTRGSVAPKLGKRTRRAVIQVRHAIAAELFWTWLWKTKGMCALPGDQPHKIWPTLWHRWNALGRP